MDSTLHMVGELVITSWHWAGFIVCVLVFLAMDLGVFHRQGRVVRFKEALVWTGIWFALAMAFAALLDRELSREKATLFVTGYIVELSLSMDNVFVMALIFRYFRVPGQWQHRVLFWGIIGALLMRGIMIWLGSAIIQRFEGALFLFGAFLVFTGFKMMFVDDDGVHPETNPILKLARRFFPVTENFEGQHFLVRREKRAMLTPLALVLLMVETTDLVFALDSIPAIFGITQDPFIIFTSNVFAILGLRSLYFVLAGALGYFRYLKYGLSLVLVFIGAKMLLKKWWYVETNHALMIVGGIILVSIVVSFLFAKPEKSEDDKADE